MKDKRNTRDKTTIQYSLYMMIMIHTQSPLENSFWCR